MDIIAAIKDFNFETKKYPLIIAIHILLEKLKQDEKPVVLNGHFKDLMELSHKFYLSSDKEYKKKYKRIIAEILEKYSDDNNCADDIEFELSKLTEI